MDGAIRGFAEWLKDRDTAGTIPRLRTMLGWRPADIVLVRSDPRDATEILELARATHRKMVQNLFWATGYNVVAIPLAAGVLYGVGVVLSPAVGALIMSLSTVIVAINARLLGRGRRGGEAPEAPSARARETAAAPA